MGKNFMNSKRLRVVLGCLLAGMAGVAGADVKLYGQLDVSVDSVDRDNVGDSSDINLGSNTSAIGVKGSEDLGNGLNAFFKVEYQTDMVNDKNGDGWNGRDQYLGMGSRFGRLYGGTMSTAYKSDASALDPMYRTRIQSRNVGLQSLLHSGKGEDGQGRATNTVRYDSPVFFSGLSGSAHYTLDSNANDGNDDNPWGAGARYKRGNIYAFADYITNSRSGDSDAWQFGGKYTWGSANFWGMYEIDGGLISTNTWGTDNNGDGADVWTAGASYEIFGALLAFSYGQGLDGDAKAGGQDIKTEYNTWRLSGQYAFSKRTKIYGGFSEQDCNRGNQGSPVVNDMKFCQVPGEDDIFTLGMRHNF